MKVTHVPPSCREDMVVPTADQVVAIVEEHTAFVWRTLRYLGVRERDLDDACQEVLVVVCRKLHGFEGRSSIKTWLRGICVRTAAAYRRRRHVWREVLVELPEGRSTTDNPERTIENSRRLDLLQRALDRLDDHRREVFVLHQIEQLPMSEVAEVLECNLQTAYSRYHAAKERVVSYMRQAEREAS